MKHTFPSLLTLGIWATSASFSHADTYIESKIMGSMSAKTWTSGLSQRTETPNPLTGSPIIRITRVDKGVIWTLDARQKIYDEKPIALTYTKAAPPDTGGGESSQNLPAETGGKLEIRQIPEPRTIAGFIATGYEMGVGSESSGTLWMTPPTGILADVDKETTAFQEAYNKKLFENYPTTERSGMASGMKMFGDMMKGSFDGLMKSAKNGPKGFPLAMEGINDHNGETRKLTVFEIQKISNTPAPDGFFDIPADFKKVDDVATAQAQEMMKSGNLEDMMKQLKKIGGVDADQ